MQLRADQLPQHLARGLKALYTLHGDEPLLAQEAGDAIRAAARAAGHTERKVYTVGGAHFDWSAVLGASQAMSLFADRQLIEIRIPGGKPGKDGSEALQRYCRGLSDEVLTIVHLPRLDRQLQQSAWFGALDEAGVSVRIDPIERRALPAWLAQRLAAQGQRVGEGSQGEHTLAFFADRVEGNLLAAHQEIQKLALLYPSGELSFEQVESAVLNVARYDVFKLGEAVLAGQTARVLRMLDGLRAEGEATVLVHWTLAADILALKQVHDAMAHGRPLPMALNEARVWGNKQRLFERVMPLLADHQVAHLVEAASVCDGVIKGLKHPAWPMDAWDAVRRLALLVVQAVASAPPARGRAPVMMRLALQAEHRLD
ncbi:MAG: DNA polymerase III subunit delta [Ideonella sp.]|nr:DNA polymerase III subunit delta [Ideonella sp.]